MADADASIDAGADVAVTVATDTITAIATASGQGGVGIVRVSGPLARTITEKVIGSCPPPRYAHYGDFVDADGSTLDKGLTLFFQSPNSFTGEDVVEFHAHGGPVVLDLLLNTILGYGARPARAGEFSERAYLNDKIDLARAEAIADLIAADSEQAARAAMCSLQGVFSSRVHELVEALIQFRIHVESALDFPEEEIDFLADKIIAEKLNAIITSLDELRTSASQGRLLKEGMHVVIAGKPNAGKSSLLNRLAGQEAAIVTDIPGTTRDILREHIQIDGLPIHIIDTAGLRDSEDVVEQEGIRRAREAIGKADRILYMMTDESDLPDENSLPTGIPLTLIRNKIDLTGEPAAIMETEQGTRLYLSVKTGEGIELLKQHLKNSMGYQQSTEGQFIARRRHLDAINAAAEYLGDAEKHLNVNQAGELLAEECRLAQQELSSITGEFSSDDLLGRIFSDFCIGK
jgi:tRNA modification GTPase